MSDLAPNIATQSIAPETRNPKPITVHPDSSLPANAPAELVQAAVDKATAEAPRTGHVEQQVVIKGE